MKSIGTVCTAVVGFGLLVVAGVQILAVAPPQDTVTGVLEGVVVRVDSGEPIAGAQVILTSSLSPLNAFNGPSPIPAGTTGADGRFSFKNMKPATYRIAVTAIGYVRQEYGKKGLAGTGVSVYLAAGQTVKDLSVALTPAAAIAGRILDDKGQPTPGILVQLVEETYSTQGKGFRGVGMANADDRGEYRMYGVTPGRYYLVAGSVQVSQTIPPGEGDVMMIHTSRINYAPTFYPGVPELRSASMIELEPDAYLHADFKVKQQSGFRVSGRVIDSTTGQPSSDARISIGPLYSPMQMIQPMLGAMRNTGTAGTFEFLNVPPGEWAIRAEVPPPIVQGSQGPPDPATAAARSTAQALRPLGQAAVHVTNANVDGLTVILGPGFSVPVHIRVEGTPLSSVPNLQGIYVRLQASESGMPSQLSVSSPSVTRPGPDGTFQIDGVRVGEFLMSASGIPQGFYLKSAQYAGSDVLYAPITFSKPGSDAIELMLRAGPGQVSGTVSDSKSMPVSGISVVLVPELSKRNRPELYKTARTDQVGHFAMPDIPPGDYKIFSWEAMPQGNYYNPDVMKQFEAQGRAIHIVESSNETVDVKMIPPSE